MTPSAFGDSAWSRREASTVDVRLLTPSRTKQHRSAASPAASLLFVRPRPRKRPRTSAEQSRDK
eukprot:scaffold1528_cov198-Pinguiococcus_pyrenoidosus.AAC.23